MVVGIGWQRFLKGLWTVFFYLTAISPVICSFTTLSTLFHVCVLTDGNSIHNYDYNIVASSRSNNMKSVCVIQQANNYYLLNT